MHLWCLSQCVCPENILTPPTEGIGIPWGLGDSVRPKNLRYHGWWILTKNGKKLFFAVRIENTEINILQKVGKKTFLLFKIEEKNLFLNLINPQRCIDKFLSSLIKIHRQLSRVMWIAVWFQLNEETCTRLTRTVLDRWFLSQVSFYCWQA